MKEEGTLERKVEEDVWLQVREGYNDLQVYKAKNRGRQEGKKGTKIKRGRQRLQKITKTRVKFN